MSTRVSRVSGLVCLAILAGQVAVAAAPALGVVVDGQVLKTDRPPVSCQGTLLLPMRAVFEALEAQVRWLPKERKVEARRGDRLVELWMGTPVAQINRTPVQLNTPPLLVRGTAYVPLRFVAEAFGAVVRWDEFTQTAFIYRHPSVNP